MGAVVENLASHYITAPPASENQRDRLLWSPAIFFSFNHRYLNRPMQNSRFYQQFLISHEHRFIYCYIPKVACSSLKLWFMRVTESDAHEANPEIHSRADETFSLATLPQHEADELLRSSDYFRFAFMRNPFARLVSAYLDKVVNADGPGVSVTKQFQKGRPWQLRKRWRYRWRKLKTGSGVDLQRGISFREFVRHIASQPPQQLDPHWRPQTLIMGDVPMNFVGQLEYMAEDFDYVCRQLDLKNDLQVINRSGKRVHDYPQECYADWTRAQLRHLGTYPPFECFYTPELKKVFLRVYQQDVTEYQRLTKQLRSCRDAAESAA